jgi:serpin B
MRRRILAAVLSITLTLSLITSLTGCGNKVKDPIKNAIDDTVKNTDLMSGIKPNVVTADVDITGDTAVKVTDFAVRLFQNSMSDENNTLISPVSVLSALAMTANGAKGNTLTQM